MHTENYTFLQEVDLRAFYDLFWSGTKVLSYSHGNTVANRDSLEAQWLNTCIREYIHTKDTNLCFHKSCNITCDNDTAIRLPASPDDNSAKLNYLISSRGFYSLQFCRLKLSLSGISSI